MAADEGSSSAPRFAGDKQVASSRNRGQQPGKRHVIEVMQEEIRHDYVPSEWKVRRQSCCSPVEHVHTQRFDEPPEAFEGGARLLTDEGQAIK
jgi:hypothetical protein